MLYIVFLLSISPSPFFLKIKRFKDQSNFIGCQLASHSASIFQMTQQRFLGFCKWQVLSRAPMDQWLFYWRFRGTNSGECCLQINRDRSPTTLEGFRTWAALTLASAFASQMAQAISENPEYRWVKLRPGQAAGAFEVAPWPRMWCPLQEGPWGQYPSFRRNPLPFFLSWF